jgi:uncharacterized membrane protein (UPF0182 family)
VLAAFGDRVAFGASLTEALNSLFGAGAGNQAPDAGGNNNSPSPSGSASASPSGSAPSSPAPGGGTISPQLQAALTQLATAVGDLQQAYKSGDVTAIGNAQTAVNKAAEAVAAARGGG